MRARDKEYAMYYPIWDPPLVGASMVIAVVAVIHIFISHFAIGGGLFLVLSERKARKANDSDLLTYLKSHSKFFVRMVLVYGAVTGVGIWYTIGLISPAATSSLIHLFVWAWAIEWVFFFVEIAAAFIYYYGWDKLTAKQHMAVGWVYFVSAWMSLFMINGILTFMLTPGDWIETGSVVDAFFNPTMLPSLIVRTGVCIALAGLYALFTGVVLKDDGLRKRVVHYAAGWMLVGAMVIGPSGFWYISQIPSGAFEITAGGAAPIQMFAIGTVVLSLGIVVLAYVGPWRRPGQTNVFVVVTLALLAFGVTGMTEMVHEAVRKPYIIYDYMYANSIRVDDVERIKEEGALTNGIWNESREVLPGRNEFTAGAEIFQMQCRSCHTVDGYNGVRLLVRNWTKLGREEGLKYFDGQLAGLHVLKPYMPPFAGTKEERMALAIWLFSIGEREPLSGGEIDLLPGGDLYAPPASAPSMGGVK